MPIDLGIFLHLLALHAPCAEREAITPWRSSLPSTSAPASTLAEDTILFMIMLYMPLTFPAIGTLRISTAFLKALPDAPLQGHLQSACPNDMHKSFSSTAAIHKKSSFLEGFGGGSNWKHLLCDCQTRTRGILVKQVRCKEAASLFFLALTCFERGLAGHKSSISGTCLRLFQLKVTNEGVMLLSQSVCKY